MTENFVLFRCDFIMWKWFYFYKYFEKVFVDNCLLYFKNMKFLEVVRDNIGLIVILKGES